MISSFVNVLLSVFIVIHLLRVPSMSCMILPSSFLMKHWPIVSAAMCLSSVSADVIFRAKRAFRMEHALLEWGYPNRFHPSYASEGSFLESNTRDRFLLAESAIFPIMSKRCTLTWYILTVINWVTPSATIKKRSSAVLAKGSATTLSTVKFDW